jgi:hypothetical protein
MIEERLSKLIGFPHACNPSASRLLDPVVPLYHSEG